MKDELLYEYLKKYVDVDKYNVIYDTIPDLNQSFEQLRFHVNLLGRIVEENQEDKIIVYAVQTGKSAFSNAVVGVRIVGSSLNIASYAEEGIIKQHIAEYNINDLKKEINGKSTSTKKVSPASIMLGIAALTAVISVSIINGTKKKPEVLPPEAINESSAIEEVIETTGVPAAEDPLKTQYTNLMTNYNTVANAYNDLVKTISIVNIDGLPDYYDIKEAAIEDNNPITQEEIDNLSKDLEVVITDYNLISKLEAPTEKWVMQQIKGIDHINQIAPVTPDHDPDKLLNKDGSYYSCIYFSLDTIDQSKIPGITVVDKGTDAGGAIELYDSLDKAMNRCEYLKQFDNTLLYSGSYAVLGKMVIRTSYLLSNEDQNKYTKLIADKLLS